MKQNLNLAFILLKLAFTLLLGFGLSILNRVITYINYLVYHRSDYQYMKEKIDNISLLTKKNTRNFSSTREWGDNFITKGFFINKILNKKFYNSKNNILRSYYSIELLHKIINGELFISS